MISGLWINLDQLRFDPFRIDFIPMLLATVINGIGNGNSDDVSKEKMQRVFNRPSLNVIAHQFLLMALGSGRDGMTKRVKDSAGRPMGSIIASTRGNLIVSSN